MKLTKENVCVYIKDEAHLQEMKDAPKSPPNNLNNYSMKTKLYPLIAATILLVSCQKEIVKPENIIRYEVSCEQCTIEFTNNDWNDSTHRQKLNVSGYFQTSFSAKSGTKAKLKVSSFPGYGDQKVFMKITGIADQKEWTGMFGVNYVVGKEIEL